MRRSIFDWKHACFPGLSKLLLLSKVLLNDAPRPPDHSETAGDAEIHSGDEERSHARQLRQRDYRGPGIESRPAIGYGNPLGKSRPDGGAAVYAQKVGIKAQRSAAPFHFGKLQSGDEVRTPIFVKPLQPPDSPPNHRAVGNYDLPLAAHVAGDSALDQRPHGVLVSNRRGELHGYEQEGGHGLAAAVRL